MRNSVVCPAPCAVACRDCDVSQINYMYAQYVKNTMEPLNISDVTKDQRFPWTVRTQTPTQDKSLSAVVFVLCHP